MSSNILRRPSGRPLHWLEALLLLLFIDDVIAVSAVPLSLCKASCIVRSQVAIPDRNHPRPHLAPCLFGRIGDCGMLTFRGTLRTLSIFRTCWRRARTGMQASMLAVTRCLLNSADSRRNTPSSEHLNSSKRE
ncbi:hypothetical protein L227DRAFT_100252 [Lentinus tigrinus ALCF2SS1-6]|uniref:Secreted protein n=1 Tax=Lentinus tigrinus ALCF2SS1-6 TaxID=1328759 RepID=A0A5C2SAR8_9APHY|nr:hypothetical protein L227DRAFT_100252 [Lentinus tigrinus ALCF2SS1-6]